MEELQNFKQNILKSLAAKIVGKTVLEKILCYLCSHSLIRNNLKSGAIAFAYPSILDKPEARIADMGSYRFWVNIAEYSGVNFYFLREHHEPFTAWLVSELVNPGDICIDVGANIGSYTFLLASKVGSKGRVVAFEPQLDLYTMILDSINLNHFGKFVFADSRALYSDSGETLKFYISENINNSGTSSLINHGVFLNEDNFIQVQTITLSDYFKEVDLEKCNLLKVDVERAELDVIKGAIALLNQQRIDYILLEQLANSDAEKLLYSVGYPGWLVDEDRKVLVNLEVVIADYFGNYLFVSPSQAKEFQKRFHSLLKDTL
jgi:FkbM family methyltransferase